MIATMNPELQRIYEDYWPYEMHKELAEKFRKQERIERCEVVKDFTNSKPRDGESICTHVQRMQGYVDRLRKLVMTVHEDAPRAKSSGFPHVTNPKEADSFYCKEKGHWKRSCPKYLQDIKDGKVKPTQAEESRELEHGRLNLVMGNRRTSPVTKISVYRLVLSSGFSLELHNCCYSPDMARNIISFHALFRQGYYYTFDKLNGSISVFKNDVFIFNALPCDGVYETIICVDNCGNNVLNIDSSSGVEKACLWHCRLGHINKKRIAQLQKDGVLESFDLKSDDVYESCLFGKMTKSPFKGSFERGEGLLDIIHTDVCGRFRTTTKDGTRFYVTFTDDFSRYGYIYLIKHKSDTFEKFKEFKNEVENQLGRKIKMLRSDRRSEYLEGFLCNQ
ncbi:hypothetical protein L2E82_10883 [Cichorium intybus]|uniref:Uncharacterized protein n=1 Tax=Cichorium intybus TaxID=13427 RepID=A0ACB9GCW9_CICIN|nr:hypothetical protein L2E82_10883 [Cichorium intybus]